MTSRERVEAALLHREPDRTPWFEYVLLSPLADLVLGRPYADYAGDCGAWLRVASETGWERAVRRYARDRVDLALALGHDMLYVVPNPPPPAAAGPAHACQGPAAGADAVERVRARTRAGEHALSPPQAETLLVYHLVREEMRRREIDLPVLAPAYLHGVWTDTDLMECMALAPDVAASHFSLATRRAVALVDAYAAIGIDQAGVGGDFAGNRPIISPAHYREFIVPGVRTVTRRAHALGLRAVNASDGDLWSVLDDFLVGCEVDGYLEIDAGAGMDMARLKAAYGDRVTLYGNMDCGRVLSFATPEEVADATRACLRAGRGSGGHIFCCSNAVTAGIPPRNYAAMLNAYRREFGLDDVRLLDTH